MSKLNCTCCGKQINLEGCNLNFDEFTPIKDKHNEIKAYNTEDGLVCEICKIKLDSYCCINGQSGSVRLLILFLVGFLGLGYALLSVYGWKDQRGDLVRFAKNCEILAIAPQLGKTQEKIDCIMVSAQDDMIFWECTCANLRYLKSETGNIYQVEVVKDE